MTGEVGITRLVAGMLAAERVLAGAGDVYCSCSTMHDDLPRRERPEAVYLMYCSPCEVSCCVGAVVCIGHPVCIDCCADIRANKTEWTYSKADVDIHFVAGRTRREVKVR